MLIKRFFILWVFLLTACGPVTPMSQPSAVPPSATLEIDGKTQTAGVGSYCWSNGESSTQSCAEITGIPTAKDALLTASTPFTAHFHLPLTIPPDMLTVSVMPATAEIQGGENGFRLWQQSSGWAGEFPLKNEIEYRFQDGPGLYLIQLEAHWKNYGNVRYGFLVQIGGKVFSFPLMITAAPTFAPLTVQTIHPLVRIGKGAANVLALSKDGRWLAIGTPLGVYLYETATQREIWFRTFDGELRGLVFRPDGAQLAIGLSGNQMPIVDTRNGQTALTLKGEAEMNGGWSPDGKSILTGGDCNQVLLWDAASGKVTYELQPARCSGVTPGGVAASWSGDGRRIYTIYLGGLFIWDAKSRQLLTKFVPGDDPYHSFVSLPVPSPTENRLAVSTGLGIDILDGETGKLLRTLTQDPFMGAPLRAVTWSRDGKRVLAAAGGATADTGDWFSIWDVKTGQVVSAQKKHAASEMALMPDDETLVGIALSDDTIGAVNLKTGSTVFSLGGFGNGYLVHWDTSDLLTYNGTTETRWNPISGQMIEQHISPKPDWVTVDSPYNTNYDANHLWAKLSDAAGDDAKRKQKLVELRDALKDSSVITLSPDEKYLTADQPYDELPPSLWDIAAANMLFKLDYVGIGRLTPLINAMEWSPNSRWLAGGGSLMSSNGDDDGFIVLWDVQTRKQAALLETGMKGERIQSLAWSPDQRWLAAGAVSGKIFLWDAQTYQLVAVLSGHVSYVLGLAWSSKGSLLASAGDDGTVLVWQIP